MTAQRIERILCWTPFVLLAAVLLIQVGMAEGRKLQARDDALSLFLAMPCDIGEQIYLRDPDRIVDAIRRAEGVPSHGVMYLAHRYDGHRRVPESEGRTAAADLLHRSYRVWADAGRPGQFLEWLAARWAPIGVQNDPANLNVHFLPNLLALLWRTP